MRDYARNIFRFNFRNDDVCFFVWIYEIEQFKLKVGRCFALISNHLGGFDLFVTGRRHFLLSERSLSFNNVMITLTSAQPSARTVELTSEVSSIMRELAGRSLTGTYLYLVCVKPGISTTSASKRSHC